MILTHNIIFFIFFCVTNTWAQSQVDIESNEYEDEYDQTLLDNNGVYLPVSKNIQRGDESIKIQFYYESRSPLSKDFYGNELLPVALLLNEYVDTSIYPFGNATIIEKNDEVEFKCQHGPAECYGNKLHACALENLIFEKALWFIDCLMMPTSSGSDDKVADWCGRFMKISHETEHIKNCAKGTRGTQLLLYYGELSKREKISHLPHVLINGKVLDFDDSSLFEQVCKVITNPPHVCTNGI